MVTLTSADNILKSVYLDAIVDQINTKTNPFYNMIKKGSENVVGKEIICATRFGLNGGMGSASETGTLPKAVGNNYIALKADLKNIYGTIEVSDKALRASETSAGALVNVLNAEMEGLLESAKFNFGRMLYQNGTGKLAKLVTKTGVTAPEYAVDDTRNLIEGMSVDVIKSDGSARNTSAVQIVSVDRVNNKVKLSASVTGAAANDILVVQQSYNAELFGLEYLFDSSLSSLYGNARTDVGFMLPQTTALNAGISSDNFQKQLDAIEQKSGGAVDLILCSYDVRRKYFNSLAERGTNVDYMNIDGGFKALSFSGIPVIADRFVESETAYFLNTNDFKLQQLCDWKWIEGDNGSVLRQLESKPAYQATLVKYANLICTRPIGQGKMTGIKEAGYTAPAEQA